MHHSLFLSMIRLCIIVFLIISLQGLTQGKEIKESFSDKIGNFSILSDINYKYSDISSPLKNSSYSFKTHNENILKTYSPPFQLQNIQALKQKSNHINIISDNYSSVQNSFPEKNCLYTPDSTWENNYLNWINDIEPNGDIIVSSGINNPDEKLISIIPGTKAKGLLLFSSLFISKDTPSLSFDFQGHIMKEDGLVFLVKENDNINNFSYLTIPDGNYNDPFNVNLSAYSGKKISLIMGAYFLSNQKESWNLSKFSFISEKLLENNSIDFQNFIQKSNFNLTETFQNYPNIEDPIITNVLPKNIINNNQEFSINIYGDHIKSDAIAFINRSESEKVFSQKVVMHTPHNLTATFSDTNLASDSYSVGIINPDGSLGYIDSALTIHTPNKPIINSIWPDTGINDGRVNISDLKISHYSSGDTIFLSRVGYNQIDATNIRIIDGNTLTCYFVLTGAPVGFWNLTIEKRNGKSDKCVDCFMVTGPVNTYYSYFSDLSLKFNEKDSTLYEGITIDQNDKIYLTDTLNNLIKKYSSDGILIKEWGGNGSENGKFIFPAAIAVSQSDSLYVIDKGNGRIQKFSTDGNFISTWGTKGNESGQFNNPSGIAIDSLEQIYISDTGNHRIQKFTNNGEFLKTWGTQGGYSGQFNFPTGMIFGANETLYVIDNGNDRIQLFDTNGNIISTFGRSGTDNGEFLSPGSITRDSSNNIFVSDLTSHQIQKFNETGTYLTKWGSYGEKNGHVLCPNAIAVNQSGFVYVVDCITGRISIYEMIEDFQFYTEPTIVIPETIVPVELSTPVIEEELEEPDQEEDYQEYDENYDEYENINEEE